MAKPALPLSIPPGTEFAVRVTPKAARNAITIDGDTLRAYTTTVPEDGKATQAVIKLLAKSMGVAKSRITLVSGATSRDKRFRLD